MCVAGGALVPRGMHRTALTVGAAGALGVLLSCSVGLSRARRVTAAVLVGVLGAVGCGVAGTCLGVAHALRSCHPLLA